MTFWLSRRLAAPLIIIAVFSTPVLANNHVPVPIDSSYALIFDEEFNGNTLDTTKWQVNGYTDGTCGPPNNPPPEQTNYQSNQVTLPGDGTLHILLTQASNTCGGSTQPFSGNIVNTASPAGNGSGNPGKFSFTHGYIESRVFFPAATDGSVANWPSFWMTGVNTWPATGEFDIIEIIGGNATGCFHNATSGGICQVTGGGTANSNYNKGHVPGWHVMGLLWSSTSITWYMDGTQIAQVTTNVTNDPMVIALEQSQGTLGGPTLNNAVVQFDYVHVYQQGGVAVTPQANYGGPGDAGPSSSYTSCGF